MKMLASRHHKNVFARNCVYGIFFVFIMRNSFLIFFLFASSLSFFYLFSSLELYSCSKGMISLVCHYVLCVCGCACVSVCICVILAEGKLLQFFENFAPEVFLTGPLEFQLCRSFIFYFSFCLYYYYYFICLIAISFWNLLGYRHFSRRKISNQIEIGNFIVSI